MKRWLRWMALAVVVGVAAGAPRMARAEGPCDVSVSTLNEVIVLCKAEETVVPGVCTEGCSVDAVLTFSLTNPAAVGGVTIYKDPTTGETNLIISSYSPHKYPLRA